MDLSQVNSAIMANKQESVEFMVLILYGNSGDVTPAVRKRGKWKSIFFEISIEKNLPFYLHSDALKTNAKLSISVDKN